MSAGNIANLGFKHNDDLKPNVLFVTSNGAGMGHITRCLAIATAARNLFNSSFLTLSTSAAVVGEQGFEYIYFKSAGNTGLPARTWNDNFYQLLSAILKRNDFSAIVFDGTWIYRGLRDAVISYPDIDLIWLRRGLWKLGSPTEQIPEMEDACSLIISPWDAGKKFDQGPLNEAVSHVPVKGIVFRPCKPLTRPEALAGLNLDASKRYCLIQLGAGNINNIAGVREFVTRTIVEKSGGSIIPIIAQSPLSVEIVNVDNVTVIHHYPLSPMLEAFEFIVTAGGYNTVHEILNAGIPALILPNLEASTDDQVARARGASEYRAVFSGGTKQEIEEALIQLIRINEEENFFSESAKAMIHIDDGSDAAQRIFQVVSRPRMEKN